MISQRRSSYAFSLGEACGAGSRCAQRVGVVILSEVHDARRIRFVITSRSKVREGEVTAESPSMNVMVVGSPAEAITS